MKRLIAVVLAAAVVASPSALTANEDDIQTIGDQTDALYRVGAGSQDGAYTSLAVSMLGWGLGLGIGIAVLAALLHQSSSGHGHAHCD
jgi:hypothetical protein